MSLHLVLLMKSMLNKVVITNFNKKDVRVIVLVYLITLIKHF